MTNGSYENDMDYQWAIKNRMEILRRQIEEQTAARDAVESSIAKAKRELEYLKAAYPSLSGNGSADAAAAKRITNADTADTVVELLSEAGNSMHYREIYRGLLERGLPPPVSGDPAQAVLARFYNDPRLSRTGRGIYALAGQSPNGQESHVQTASSPTVLRMDLESPSDSKKHEKPTSITLLGEEHPVNGWIEVLRRLCEELYRLDEDSFRSSLMELKTSTGTPYFSLNQGDFKQDWKIPGSGIFVGGGISSKEVRNRCRKILQQMGIDPESEFSIGAGDSP